MKDKTKIISLVLIALTIVCMFLPIATFHENSAGALSGEIAKQQDKVDRAQAKLDRDTKSGKDAEALAKDQAKLDKEQTALDELLKQQENALFISEITTAFAKVIDMKDSYTNGHSFRVAKYTAMLARELGCDEETVEKSTTASRSCTTWEKSASRKRCSTSPAS